MAQRVGIVWIRCSMIAGQRIDVDLSQLKVGLSLKYDLVTPSDQLLARVGDIVTAAMKIKWRTEGIQRALAIVTSAKPPLDSSTAPTPFTRPYDPIVMERLGTTLKQASKFVLKSAQDLIDGDFSSATEIRWLFQQLRLDATADIATVLAAFAQYSDQELSENDELIAHRSSLLSTLGLILADQLRLSVDDQLSAALAGMFHDIALLDCVRNHKGRLHNSDYLNHSMDSAWLLESAIGINAKIGLAVAQIHEQVDGTGFPKRLPANRIIPIARILNVADAYLTLTGSVQAKLMPQARNFHPADALGYLMYHAARGRFDRTVVRALITATSLYPVGCRVKLSDNSTAVVMRSATDNPSKPIVRVETGHETIIDLRKSELAIVQPTMSPIDYCRRIPKSSLAEVYWR
jgi:HD-GYP domain-containing protein (c-di-GMP phosphodiesterase class II)